MAGHRDAGRNGNWVRVSIPEMDPEEPSPCVMVGKLEVTREDNWNLH